MSHTLEALEKLSRRSLWTALALILALAAGALALILFPDTGAAAMATRAGTLLPIAIVLACAALHSSQRGMKAILADELRQQSLHRANRNGLLAVLLAQPLLALLFTLLPMPMPQILMASMTMLTGAATVLVSLLIYDR